MVQSPQSWTVKVELLSTGEVDLHAVLEGGESVARCKRCSFDEAVHQLEVLFDCFGDADFSLAVRSPDGPWCQLSTRRWRLALYFLTSQYERAFADAKPVKPQPALGKPAEHESDAPRASVAQDSGVVARVLTPPLEYADDSE